MSKKSKALVTTVCVRLYPTAEQAKLLLAHSLEYIDTVNVLVSALDADMVPSDFSTKDFTTPLPSAVKNHVLRDARSVFARSFELGRIPMLKKPFCQWNNQNWQLQSGMLTLPVHLDGRTQHITIRCGEGEWEGKQGILRIKKKRNTWIGDVTMILPTVDPVGSSLAMGIDLGIKVPAVVHIPGKGNCFFGNGCSQRAKRRQFYARRTSLQKARKVRAVRKSKGQESRWVKQINHQLSRQIVNHATK